MRLSIAENVAARALAHPDRMAIEVLGGGATFTYGQAWRRVTALAEALCATATGRHGRMAALLLPNEADAVLAYLACQMAGVAAVPISTRLAEPEIRFVVEDADAKLILAGGEFADVATEIASGLGIQAVRVEDIETPNSVDRPILGEGGRGAEPCVVGYTSGTTGFPKGALYSNDHYLTALMRWGWEFGLTADQVMLVPGPLFHLSYAGLSMAALCIGARVRIMPEFRAELALSELRDHCSFAFLVPSMTTMIEEEWRRQDRPAIDAFLPRAGPVVHDPHGHGDVSQCPDLGSLWLDRGRLGHLRGQGEGNPAGPFGGLAHLRQRSGGVRRSRRALRVGRGGRSGRKKPDPF